MADQLLGLQFPQEVVDHAERQADLLVDLAAAGGSPVQQELQHERLDQIAWQSGLTKRFRSPRVELLPVVDLGILMRRHRRVRLRSIAIEPHIPQQRCQAGLFGEVQVHRRGRWGGLTGTVVRRSGRELRDQLRGERSGSEAAIETRRLLAAVRFGRLGNCHHPVRGRLDELRLHCRR